MLTGGMLLGILLGLRHALEPDHLAAVSTLVTERGTRHSGGLVGIAWGTGHTVALFAVALVLTALSAQMPPRLGDALEFGVALMLVVLGARSIHRASGTHRHAPPPGPGSRWGFARRPLVVGLVHGLAGSGALTALAMAAMPTPLSRLVYAVVFGLGSILGMGLMTGVVGLPLARLAGDARLSRGLGAAAGVLSLLLGVWWGLPIAGRLLVG